MSSPVLPIETHTKKLVTPAAFVGEALVYRPEHVTIEIGRSVVDGPYFNGMVYFNGARAYGAW